MPAYLYSTHIFDLLLLSFDVRDCRSMPPVCINYRSSGVSPATRQHPKPNLCVNQPPSPHDCVSFAFATPRLAFLSLTLER